MNNNESVPIDPNNPKHIWLIHKFCDNKSEYLEYHARVEDAFKQDCENLLLAFAAREDLRFTVFVDVWQELYFSLVFVGHEFFSELEVFAESCFFIIKKYLIFSTNVYVQVGAFYLLHGIYGKQLTKDMVPIRMTFEEYSILLKLVEYMHRNDNTEDFLHIFKNMLYNKAFQFVATTRCLGLEPKFTWQERKMKNDIFQNTMDSNPVTKLEKILFSDDNQSNLNSLNSISNEYDQAIKDYAISTSSQPLTIHKESHVVQEVEDLFKNLQEEVEPEIINHSRIVAELKKSIRDKAFQIINRDKHNATTD